MGQSHNFQYNVHDDQDTESMNVLDAVLERYYTYYHNEVDPGLERIERVLKLMGNPEKQIAPAVHVAGTNGKGSTLAFLQSILEGEEMVINKMTSPHLISFHERLYLGGNFIETQPLVELLESVEPIFKENEISFFEAVTAATYKCFSECKSDYCLIETGMGGRFDATNVLEQPALTLITTISKDHQNFLGNTIEKIAWEKAGIMKPGVPCIVGPQIYPEALDVIKAEAEKIGAPIYAAGHDWFIDKDQNGQACLFLEAKNGWPIEPSVYVLPSLKLQGHHQAGNAALALLAGKILLSQKRQDYVDIGELCAHLQSAYWPGRLQSLAGHPYANYIDDRDELWLDGAHNDSAAMALAAQCRLWKQDKNTNIVLVLGMIQTKEVSDFIDPLRPYISGVATVPVPTDWRSHNPKDLLELAVPLNDTKCKNLGAYDSVESCISEIPKIITSDDGRKTIYLITGSLYLAGSVLGADKNAKNYFS